MVISWNIEVLVITLGQCVEEESKHESKEDDEDKEHEAISAVSILVNAVKVGIVLIGLLLDLLARFLVFPAAAHAWKKNESTLLSKDQVFV